MCGFDFQETEFAISRVGILQSAEFAAEPLEIFGTLLAVRDDGETFELFSEFEGEAFLGVGGNALRSLCGIALGTLVREFAQTVAAFCFQ